MKRDESIRLLNRTVADELQAVHQYMYFHFHLDDQGLGPLAMQFKRTAIEEMVHIERIAERILFLKGEIDLAPSGPVERITDPVAMMKKAMQMEEGSIVDYNNAAIECTKLADAVSKQLFESLITDEERHFDAFEKQADNIERFGQSYLALQSFQQSEPEPGA